MSHIVFGSGRAGVGVTTVAALVAGAAARRGGSDVVVVDLAGNGGLAPLLGRYAPTVRTLQDTADARMSTGNVRLDLDAVAEGLVSDSLLRIRALLAAPGRPNPHHLDVAIQAVEVLRDAGCHVVIDLGASIDRDEPYVRTLLRSAESVVLVTTLAAPSVFATGRLAERLVEETRVFPERLRLVVSHALRGTGMTAELVAESVPAATLLGAVPLASREVLDAVNRAALGMLLVHPVLGPAFGTLAQELLPVAAPS
jgi:MinD-like ATPase involved in chromosome partitioning or flagellar assembly